MIKKMKLPVLKKAVYPQKMAVRQKVHQKV